MEVYDKNKHGDEFRAIVVPQEVNAGTELFKITVDGVVYTFKKNEAFTYVPSKMHNFTIRVDKKENTGAYEFVLVSESITAWENDEITSNLEGICSWVDDMEGYFDNMHIEMPTDIDWRFIATLFYAGKIYE